MQEIVYGPGKQNSVMTPKLGDGEIAVVHFRTPKLAAFGNGGWCAFANDLNNTDVELGLSKDPDPQGDFGIGTAGLLDGMIYFRAVIPHLQSTRQYRQLQSDTDYYIKVKSHGVATQGIKVKVQGGNEGTHEHTRAGGVAA